MFLLYMFICVYIYIYKSPLTLHLAGQPGVYQALSGPCDHVPLLGQHTTWAQGCDCVFSSGGAPTDGRCPVFSTTALQDLGCQPQRHPSPPTSPAPHHVGASR